jgi:archaellum component FlaF (FlaF/FlaG flagellin family)
MKHNLAVSFSLLCAVLINVSTLYAKAAENSGQTNTAPAGKETILPDGTKILVDGTIVHPNGTKVLPNGNMILPDGTVIKPQ